MARICIVNFHIYCMFDSKSGASMGGSELDMFVIAKWLSKKHQVSIVTGDWGQKSPQKFDDLTVYKSAKLGNQNYLLGAYRLWSALKRVNADIYIATGAGAEIYIIAWYCKLHHKKFVYRTASDAACDTTFIKSHGLSGRLFQYGMEHSSFIVATIKNHIPLLHQHHPRIACPITQIDLGIMTDQPIPSRKQDTILWVSRCIEIKRPEMFIDLAKEFPKLKFVMVCPSQYHAMDYYHKVKKQASKVKNLEFHDYIPFNQIQKYYDNARVFINTSDFEGFTYTLIQSGLASTPIAYLRVNPDSVITKYQIGYCANGDVLALKSAVSKLTTDQKDWSEKSKNIHNYVIANHGMDSIGPLWDKVIDAVWT